MKTSELIGAVLDWAVAKCEEVKIGQPEGRTFAFEWSLMHDAGDMNYSTDWAQGGPIIEREKITLEWTGEGWNAYIRHDDEYPDGPTPLIAAMRCFVASKLGDEVEIPEELK